jgi:predicted nucleotidyltransferase
MRRNAVHKNAQITTATDALKSFCQRWRITELALFGSVLTDQFNEESDVDVLVTFEPDVAHSFKHLVIIQEELEAIYGRPVDLLTKQAIQDSPNYIRRKTILDSAKVVYAG